ncbi:peptidoglycan DD-metalloendopeptidase family protein [Cellulomonas humilata]|uniref:Peptidoglycan DD-metalloendopeptidase family protein n=1 Tax=Cellulomonas humilata TaxID=144055 RepID=A0A7Y6A0U0_9CELL|nr:peptidoglycan DD-metalloendopeptidase family protein [Cellulomonas humilata]
MPPSRLRRRTGAVLLAAVMALTGTGGASWADGIDDRRAEAERRSSEADRRAEELEASIEGLSAELSQAALDLQATQARLPEAQAELEDARAVLEATQREAAMLAGRLQDATDLRGSLTSTIAADRADEVELRAAVGAMAREAYRGAPGVSAMDVMLDAENATDFLDNARLVDAALRSQARVLDELRQVDANNRNSEARLGAVTDRVAELKEQAEANVIAAAEAQRVAQAREDEINQLIADQSARQDAIASLKTQAEAEQTEIDAERAAIERDLVAIIAEQRAAREAAEAAARAAEAAARAAAEAAARAAAEAAGREPPPPPPPPPAQVQPPVGAVSGALFANPTSINPMYVTSEYGMRLHPILGYVRLHAGIDLRTGCNTPLYAPRDATVLWSQWRNGFGNQVMLDYGTVEGNSVMSSSNHLTRSIVRAGQDVARGQLIGYAGNTGLSGACHLHFEVYVNGSTVNPRPLLGR